MHRQQLSTKSARTEAVLLQTNARKAGRIASVLARLDHTGPVLPGAAPGSSHSRHTSYSSQVLLNNSHCGFRAARLVPAMTGRS
jgi:hypothetical protein